MFKKFKLVFMTVIIVSTLGSTAVFATDTNADADATNNAAAQTQMMNNADDDDGDDGNWGWLGLLGLIGLAGLKRRDHDRTDHVNRVNNNR